MKKFGTIIIVSVILVILYCLISCQRATMPTPVDLPPKTSIPLPPHVEKSLILPPKHVDSEHPTATGAVRGNSEESEIQN